MAENRVRVPLTEKFRFKLFAYFACETSQNAEILPLIGFLPIKAAPLIEVRL
jgi:hypothetical protein